MRGTWRESVRIWRAVESPLAPYRLQVGSAEYKSRLCSFIFHVNLWQRLRNVIKRKVFFFHNLLFNFGCFFWTIWLWLTFKLSRPYFIISQQQCYWCIISFEWQGYVRNDFAWRLPRSPFLGGSTQCVPVYGISQDLEELMPLTHCHPLAHCCTKK